MKSKSFSLLLLLLPLLAEPSSGAPETVIDVDGRPVTTNSSYLIYPVGSTEGGLTLSPPNASYSCPFYVTQAEGIDNTVDPARFFPVTDSETDVNVRVSTDMNIDFNAFDGCTESTVWQLGPAAGQRRLVKTGGVKGSPGIKTLSNWFKIERDLGSKGNVYKLVFCPSVCSFCRVACGELGVVRNGGKRLLGLAPNLKPHLVVFKEA